MEKLTIEQLQKMSESEDHVEFKSGSGGRFPYNGTGKSDPARRRHCILGYAVALCNEGGGHIVIGMNDEFPHQVVGTIQNENSLGKLESDLYRDLGIRPFIYELYDSSNKRVLVIRIPSRPTGRVCKFEDVALMRVGEELKPMDDNTLHSILLEQEPDFSEQICQGATLNDLDPEAVGILKEKYSARQDNPQFRLLSDVQALSDLKLVVGDKITNAAILLVGKQEAIRKFFPQAKVMMEFRSSESQIQFDNRLEFVDPYFKMIDQLWEAINSRNGYVPIREGAYIGLTKIPFFNENVIRELINNAFAHRQYFLASEIVIKFYPTCLDITSPGGFPKGVTLDNLLTVPSTPRNRLLADVLSKTGLVERSGQGMDKIFLYTLSEGKPEPDYTHSNAFFVSAILSSIVKDTNFALFLQTIQKDLPENEKLTVYDILALCKIRDGERKIGMEKATISKLLKNKCIEKHGRTKGQYYTLSRQYYEMSGKTPEYSNMLDWDTEQVFAVLIPYLKKYGKATKNDIMKIVGEHLSAKKLRTTLDLLKEKGVIKSEGRTSQMVYMLGDTYLQSNELINRAIEIGLKTMRDNGEI